MIFGVNHAPRQSQPQDGSGVPLFGRRWLFLFNGAGGHNMAGGGGWTSAGALFPTTVDKEQFRGPATTTSNRGFAIPSFSDDAPWTLAFRFLRPSGAAESRAMILISTTLVAGWVKVSEAATGTQYSIRANGANDRILGGAVSTGIHDGVLTYDGATLSFWFDGALIGTYSSNTMGSAARANIFIGDGTNSFSKVQGYSYVAFSIGAANAREVAELRANPWPMLINPFERDIAWSSAAGGSVIGPLIGGRLINQGPLISGRLAA